MNLRITPRAASLTIAADPTLDRPCQVNWQGPEPTVREDEDGIEISYGVAGRLRAMAPRGGSLAVALNPALDWAIVLRGGVSDLRADLRELRVSAIAITGGASDIVFDLPRPSGDLPVRIDGGVSEAMIDRPAGVPVRVEIDGGATGLRIDDDVLGAVGGLVRQRAAGEPDGEIVVHVGGGASGFTVGAR
jgi:hypothetical protein